MKHLARTFICVIGITATAPVASQTSQPVILDQTARPQANAPLSEVRSQLLSVAFETASAIPIDPHIKDRSKTQDLVVTTCLRLNQPQLALGYAQKILDWRRGSALADCAFYFAEHGETAQAQQCLDQAAPVAEVADDWRRDRIRIKIARTLELLGQAKQAAEMETDLPSSEAGRVASARAMRCDESAFDDQVRTLDAFLVSGELDSVRNVLDAYARLLDRFYTDTAKREMVERKIRSGYANLPIGIRFELLMSIAKSAIDHRDFNKANQELDDAQALVNGAQWLPEDRVSLMSRLAQARATAGRPEKAKADADAALTLYEEQRETIVDIYRAGALRSLAEACQTLGESDLAISMYRRAIDDGAGNPNSRPRAEDLAATCCSMAISGIEPGTELWTRIRETQSGLGQPW